ncbi:hypothetical protein A4S05_07440 [Nostoc sp. KVJ20]|nr:hypothetical protein A4S05_07440 [Nostoc sp. KVJ20]
MINITDKIRFLNSSIIISVGIENRMNHKKEIARKPIHQRITECGMYFLFEKSNGVEAIAKKIIQYKGG